MKRLLTAVVALMLFCSLAQADALPLGGPAPYPPVASAFGADGMSYDDGTISITIEKDVVGVTNVYFAYVKLTDVSQLRTALAAPYPSKTTRPVNTMAEEQQAVLAINGDFFSHHNRGVVVRSGEILRQQPESTRDTLVIDDNGDFVILTGNTMAEWKDYLENGNLHNSVNLPEAVMTRSGVQRLCILHRNVPGMLARITTLLSRDGVNVENLSNTSRGDYAYTLVDLGAVVGEEVIRDIRTLEHIIRLRVLD